jgi:hypothetical protein
VVILRYVANVATVCRRAVAVVVLVGGLTALGACARATPLCDDAATLAGAGALGRATETYARASRLGEGECATAGLAAAGSSYAAAFVDVDRGRVAEDARDVDTATAAYRTALAADDGNAAARDGLARLGQPAPEFREPDPDPPAAIPGEPRLELVVAVTIAATVVACGLLGLVGWVLWRRRPAGEPGVRPDRVLAPDPPEPVLAVPPVDGHAHLDALAATRDEVLGAVGDVREHLDRELRTLSGDAERQIAALQAHLDDVADYLGDRLGDRAPARERFVPAEPPGPNGAAR